MTGLTIGKIAAACGVGVETVRYYERRGLLTQPARTHGAYRSYPRETIDRLAFVREAQDLGFTLREIGDLLQLRADPAADCAAVRARTTAKLEQIEARILTCERMRATLKDLLSRCPGRGELGGCSIVEALSAPSGTPQRYARHARRDRRVSMKTGELTIEGMHCDGCAKTIEALLSAEPGVKAAQASWPAGSARVLFDPRAVALDALVKAVERAGYVVRAGR